MADTASNLIIPLPAPENALSQPRRIVFLRDLVLDAEIGAYDSEHGVKQPVCINVTLDVFEPTDPLSENLADVVCYNKLSQGIEAILAEGHIKLVETLAERIAALCLSHPMVFGARIRVEKPNAITAAAGAGVEITRIKQNQQGRPL